MTVILITLAIWGLSALLRYADRQRQMKEKEAQKREAERMRQEWRNAKLKVDLEAKRIIALEREQTRQRREQERQAKEQERQAEQLKKHEERLLRLEQRMALAEREIAHYAPMLEDLKAKARELDNRVWYLDSIGLPCTGAKNELTKINEKMYRIETKVLKAEQEKALCEKQMSA